MEDNLNEDIELEEEVIEEEGLKDKLKKLREELKAARKERDDNLAGWQRAKADFVNARKEEERARESFAKFAQAAVLLDFLKVMDSLDMALKHGAGDGMKQIYSQVKDILKQHNVTQIESEGKKFNPVEHEAIDKVEVEDESKDDVVVEDLQRGWYLFDKVLRPAKVKVGHYKKN